MIMQMKMSQHMELARLAREREKLRLKLRDHFCTPLNKRNYKRLDLLVEELAEIRQKIQELKR